MRLAPLSALLLLAACGGPPDADYDADPSFPVPWVEDDVSGTERVDAGTPDAGTPDAGQAPAACAAAPCLVEALGMGQVRRPSP
jgi:hypothetical protein